LRRPGVSRVTCRKCGTEWAATGRPCCPTCLVSTWLASPNLISEKHDPQNAWRARDEYRSIVADDVIENLRAFLEDAAARGTWYYNTECEKFNHVTRLPLQQKPGSGMNSGSVHPNRRLDDLVIADADQDPHVFADDRNETRRKIATGIYRPLDTCSRVKCDNLTRPRFRKCAIHTDPPLATRDPR
jgi:hypothetical protein